MVYEVIRKMLVSSALRILSVFYSFYVDPIPPSLMEDSLGWDVEVKAAVPTGGSVSVPAPPLKTEIQKIERPSPTQKAHGNHVASSRNTPVSALSGKPRTHTQHRLPVKSHSACGVTGRAASAKAPGGALQLEGHVENAVQTPVGNASAGQQQAEEGPPASLPQIPCLSTFKTHQPRALTFTELVGDYEHFIKEGLEKPVEIIRHYTGPGDPTVNPQNGFVRHRIAEERVQVLASGSQSGDSESDSDSDSSRTSSQSKGSKSYVEGSSDTQLKDLESAPVGGHVSLEQPLSGSDVPNLAECQQSPEIQVKARHKEGANQRAKQSRRTLPRRPSCRGPPEERWYDPRAETHVSCSGPCQDYEEYWRAYYGAWQEYYAAAAQSYYWNAQRHPSWMMAYQMNTIYLQEMMRGNQ